MIPEKYRKEKNFKQSKNLLYTSLFSVFAFLAGYLVIGPLAHELTHLAFLEIKGCNFYSQYSFNWFSGLTGVFELNCSLNQVSEVIFFATGYMATLLTGLSVVLTSRKFERFDKILLSAGLGILISMFSSLSMKSDLHSIPELQGSESILLVLLMFLAVTGATVFALDPHISEWEERN